MVSAVRQDCASYAALRDPGPNGQDPQPHAAGAPLCRVPLAHTPAPGASAQGGALRFPRLLSPLQGASCSQDDRASGELPSSAKPTGYSWASSREDWTVTPVVRCPG